MEGSAPFDATVSVTLEVPPTTLPAPTPAPSGPLPFTGAEVEVLLLVAAVLIGVGLLIHTILRTLRSRMEPSHA